MMRSCAAGLALVSMLPSAAAQVATHPTASWAADREALRAVAETADLSQCDWTYQCVRCGWGNIWHACPLTTWTTAGQSWGYPGEGMTTTELCSGAGYNSVDHGWLGVKCDAQHGRVLSALAHAGCRAAQRARR